MARGFRGVRDDLTELGRHILDIACFLHPLLGPAHLTVDSPPATPTHRHHHHRRSPSPRPATPPSPSILAGILADLAEIGGSFTGGFARRAALPEPAFSSASASASATTAESPRAASSTASSPSPSPAAAAAADVADDVVGAAQALAARPEAWIDFPVLALDESNARLSIYLCLLLIMHPSRTDCTPGFVVDVLEVEMSVKSCWFGIYIGFHACDSSEIMRQKYFS